MLNEQGIKPNDRRRFHRKPIKIIMGCHVIKNGAIANTLESVSENLGGGGVALRSPQALEKGEVMVLIFSLPLKPSAKDSENSLFYTDRKKVIEMAVRARVVWCMVASGRDYQVGLEFMWNDKFSNDHFLSYLNQNPDYAG